MNNQNDTLLFLILVGFILFGILAFLNAAFKPEEVRQAQHIINTTLPNFQKSCKHRKFNASIIDHSKQDRSICINVYSTEYQESKGILDSISKLDIDCGNSGIQLRKELDSKISKETGWYTMFRNKPSDCY